jgi:CsoR family transcriptional regulator, copper-sensing transcriptional repressor
MGDTMLNPKEKAQVLTRIKRVEGHLRKVREMIENEDYCIKTITQSMAVQSALRAVDEIILKKHLETCVKDSMVKNNNPGLKIDEVMKTIKFARK